MFIIAEIGVNHYDIAKKLSISVLDAAKLCVKEAKESGAHAAKFQTYSVDKLVSKISPAYWDLLEEATLTQYELFKKFNMFTKNDWAVLANYCKELDIEFMSTAFDLEAVDMLKGLQNYWKISSSDITNSPLLKKIAQQGGKIILSTGASNIKDIQKAVELISEFNTDIVILHCILNYPTLDENANLNMIHDIKDHFPEYSLGYSDHTKPDKNMIILTTAVLLGATYIEKHFTLDKTIKGNDHYHSMDPNDLKNFKSNLLLLEKCLGKKQKICLESEEISQNQARRSIYTLTSLNKNDILTSENMICKRPYIGGISSWKFEKLIGKKINRNLPDDYQIKKEDFD